LKLVTFAVEEANRLVPELQRRMQRMVETKREYDNIQSRMDVLSLAVSGASRQNPDTLELSQLHQQRQRLGDTLSREIASIQRHGCLVKDVDRGLVDFYALAGDRLVFLCWQLGEAEITHWHTLEGGFSQRQPLRTEPE
jgi:hypothetical protein